MEQIVFPLDDYQSLHLIISIKYSFLSSEEFRKPIHDKKNQTRMEGDDLKINKNTIHIC